MRLFVRYCDKIVFVYVVCILHLVRFVSICSNEADFNVLQNALHIFLIWLNIPKTFEYLTLSSANDFQI